jgi:hypothetical protein
MTDVAYELVIVGGELSDDESTAAEQGQTLNRIAQRSGGAALGPWEYHFPTFEAATQAAHEIRQMGLALAFDSIQIRAVASDTGKDLPS